MDVTRIISKLRKELERIDKTILALNSLETGKRRGRPPKLLQELRAQADAETKEQAEKPRRRAKKKAG